MFGIALMLVLVAARTPWRRSANWLGLALVGQAVTLQLLYSPPWGLYQHYQPWQALLNMPWVTLLGLLVAQTSVVLWGLRQNMTAICNFVRRWTTRSQSVVLLAVIAFLSAIGSQNVPQFAIELMLTLWLAAIGALTLILMAIALPAKEMTLLAESGLSRVDPDESGSWARHVPWFVAVWVVVVSGCLSSVVFERVPVIQDSVSYLFQAKYFSTGQLYLPAPADAEAFAVSHLINDGVKWYAYGFPGWPALLALGVLAGVPWLVNPVIGGLCVLIAHLLVRRLYGWRVAHAVVFLLALSPWFLVMSANHMSHSATLLWILLGWLALERARVTQAIGWALVAGCCLGALFLTRPIDGLITGGVLGLSALGLGARRLAMRALASFVFGAVAVGGLIFPYNLVLTGDPLYTPHSKWTDERFYPGADRIGFGPDIGNVGWDHLDPFPGHGVVDVVINLNKNLYQTHFELFGWMFGSLFFVLLLLVWREIRGPDRLPLALVLATAGGLSPFWFSGGPDFGARYWYPMLLPLTVLTVRGVEAVQRRLAAHHGPTGSLRVSAFIAAATLAGALNVVPWKAITKYHRYRGMSADVARLATANEFGRSLVFVRVEDTEGRHILDTTDYAAAFVWNPPTLDPDSKDPIYAFDAGDEHRLVVQSAFPGRHVWFVGRMGTPGSTEGGTDDFSPLTVIEGPVEN